jgi:HlyD family secretion protein
MKRQQLQDDLDQAYSDLKDLSIIAPADGIVTDIMLQENGMAQEGQTACTIQQNTGFKLVVAVDELDISKIKIGEKADVKIDALPNATATGEVTKISPIGVKSNDVTTYDVTLKVTAPEGTLAKMSASTDIEVAFKADALLVPVEAIHTVNGKSFVYEALQFDSRPTESLAPTATGAATNPINNRMQNFFGRKNNKANPANIQRKMIEVTVGLTSDSSAEILSGLKEGDEIAVPIAQSSSSNMFSIGGGNRQQANPDSSSGKSPSSSAGSK